MLGRTHIPVGITTALLVTRPTTVSGVLGAVAGGAIGGWICDIDVRDSDEDEGAIFGLIFMTIDVGIALVIDNFLGNGICDDFIHTWGILKVISLILFIAGCIYGFSTSHRTFMHSILAIVLFSALMFFICKPLAIPFAAGYVSHIVLDLFNRRGLQLFFPFKAKLSFGVCPSDGDANNIIGGIAAVSSILLTVIFGVLAFRNEPEVKSIIESYHSTNTDIPVFPLIKYMIVINVISFIAYLIDFLLCYFNVISEDSENTVHDFLNLFAYAGGALGALIALLILTKKGRDNAYWFIKIIAILAVWTVVLLILYDPFNLGLGRFDKKITSHIPLIVYLVLINGIAVVLFIRDRFKRRSDINSSEFLLILVGIIGGALGGYMVMVFTNGKQSFPHFAVGFPVMIGIQTFVIIFLLHVGIV